MEQNYMVYGYDRVSTKEQNPGRGIRAIEDFCKSWGLKLQKIYIDKMTGKTFERPRYTVLKEDVLRPGDWVIIPEVDRLGRTKGGILHGNSRYHNSRSKRRLDVGNRRND